MTLEDLPAFGGLGGGQNEKDLDLIWHAVIDLEPRPGFKMQYSHQLPCSYTILLDKLALLTYPLIYLCFILNAC